MRVNRYTVAEVAAIVSVSEETVVAWARQLGIARSKHNRTTPPTYAEEDVAILKDAARAISANGLSLIVSDSVT